MSAIDAVEEQENTNWGDNYTPSKDSPNFVAFHGRRQARIINGQNPMDNPLHGFTYTRGRTTPIDYRLRVYIRSQGICDLNAMGS